MPLSAGFVNPFQLRVLTLGESPVVANGRCRSLNNLNYVVQNHNLLPSIRGFIYPWHVNCIKDSPE